MATNHEQELQRANAVRLRYGENEFHFGDLRLPEGEGPHPVVIVIHGGFWKAMFDLDLMTPVSEDLARRGLATWNIEYRRVGDAGGGYPGTLQDVASAADFLRQIAPTYQLDLSRTVALGHSAGGHLAVWLAARHRLPEGSILRTSNVPLAVKGVVSLGGIIDLELMWKLIHYKQRIVSKVEVENPVADFVGGTPTQVPGRYKEVSPVALLPLHTPQILIHGDLDVNVPVKLSSLYKELAERAGDQVEMISLPNVEHFEIIDQSSEVWTKIVTEVLELTHS
ncbi:alpha/beta hydrolase [Brevibacillus choshinensis]|uniref:Alpha/beta hydrolase n=1 Tax=Brevibacillus choshinensis TaxID=54911 RepID=A0ABX7FJ89_BRECH|nr:alpha/beta hydrolase [Brevibacillus choshinensis]QRG66298.1 alpha/beta hydrolase [Brevibacillus choshinensis]